MSDSGTPPASGDLPRTLPSPAGPPGGSERLQSGAKIGRYVILRSLGEGGMGVVYAAYDPELDRNVALKLLRPGVFSSGSREGRDRLVREAQAMAKLNHPNVVSIHDPEVEGQQVFLAVELVDGEDLFSWLCETRGWREILAGSSGPGWARAGGGALGWSRAPRLQAGERASEQGRTRQGDAGLRAGTRLGGQPAGGFVDRRARTEPPWPAAHAGGTGERDARLHRARAPGRSGGQRAVGRVQLLRGALPSPLRRVSVQGSGGPRGRAGRARATSRDEGADLGAPLGGARTRKPASRTATPRCRICSGTSRTIPRAGGGGCFRTRE